MKKVPMKHFAHYERPPSADLADATFISNETAATETIAHIIG